MTPRTTSVAMTADVAETLRSHVDRPDRQEDICLATYRPSTGATRTTALITSVITPAPGEREVHDNASIVGEYVLRAAAHAHGRGEGLALCHSHPGGRGWQAMSGPDFDAEHAFANLVRELTGHPLVGLTYSGRDQSWSARHWDRGTGLDVSPTHCENVRVIGDRLDVSWNDELVAPIAANCSQQRSVSCWGPDIHSDFVRRKVLVVGCGSVGLDVAVRLAATGMVQVSVMDFDSVEPRNLDRLIGATPEDAHLGRAKIVVAERLMHTAATATAPAFAFHDLSVCEPDGLAIALDHDLIICCVDRPWARVVLNQIAYTDLVPVLDGGISIDVFDDGKGMRNATWRSHVLRPGRPCLVCNEQVDISEVSLDIQGLLDDPTCSDTVLSVKTTRFVSENDTDVSGRRQRCQRWSGGSAVVEVTANGELRHNVDAERTSARKWARCSPPSAEPPGFARSSPIDPIVVRGALHGGALSSTAEQGGGRQRPN